MRVFTFFRLTALIGFIFILSLLPTEIFSQTTGSIGGTVIDAKDKTPIAGAIIKIEGTSKGVETDANGGYVFLNMDVGTYSLICTYVGYTASRQTGIRVSVDQKTQVNFEMAEAGVKTDTLEIIAQRKGIDVEQSGRLIESQQIDNQGIHGIQNIAAKTSGVIQDEKSTALNIRGGRSSENLIIVDGVSTTNPVDGSSTAYVSNSQLQEISVLTGGFGAEYGNALSGVINVTTKSGTNRYLGSVEVISDVLTNKNWIGTNSQGYNLYNATLGGPLIPTKGLSKVINFFGGVERQFLLNSSPSWIADKLYDNGIIPNLSSRLWNVNGRLAIDLSEIKNTKIPIQLKGGISYTDNWNRSYQASFLGYDSQRWRYNSSQDMQVFARISHTVNNKFYYELQGNYYKTRLEFGDPEFTPLFKGAPDFYSSAWRNIFKVGDTNYVPGLATQGGEKQLDPTGIFRQYGTPYNFYHLSEVSYWGGKLDATWALLTKKFGNHEVKFGGEYRYHILQKMEFYSPSVAQNNYDTATGTNLEKQINLWYSGSGARMKGYGYDIVDQFGNHIVQGDDVNPRHPLIGAFYLRDKVDFPDFSFNGGVRIDYLNVNGEVLKDVNVVVGPDGSLLPSSVYQQSKANISVSPRLGFSFPVTEKTIFVAQFGKFIQMPPLDYLYTNRIAFSQFFQTSLQDVAENSSLTPEKLTSYEVGVKQTVGDYLNMGVTAYYRSTQDQIGVNKVLASQYVPIGYTIYQNSDFSVSRGLEFYLSLRRYNRFAADISYTLLYASGTGSTPTEKINLVNQQNAYPQFTFPLAFDQRHTGSVNLDYRFGESDVPKGTMGQILKNLGFNVLFSFNSGRPYTSRLLPTQPFQPSSGEATSPKNSVYTDWNFSIDLKIDKTVNIWKTSWNFYVYVTNLMNNQLIETVWEGTGRPDDDGYLNTTQGSIANTIPGYVDNYRLRIQNPFNWGPPRQIRFGIRMNI
ncbi:MAG: TonB-dependent receptor [Ignavibacteria bacterium]|jgi:outer membrane receptor protein involved in Fe transport